MRQGIKKRTVRQRNTSRIEKSMRELKEGGMVLNMFVGGVQRSDDRGCPWCASGKTVTDGWYVLTAWPG
jgi:hypothetical protein